MLRIERQWPSAREPDDGEMADRALSGDTEAFGVLIRRHREKTLQSVKSMTRDDWLAEDIVQEALIKAFLHVGQLVEPNRFLGWLKQIARNEANMKLRRGGPYRREKPFASFGTSGERYSTGHDGDMLEKLLNRLDTSEQKRGLELEPIETLLRKESVRFIRSLLHCLNERERGMFEAYFFMNCSAEEVSSMFNTTAGSVHTYLSRSKKKLRDAAVNRREDFASSGFRSSSRRRVLAAPVGRPEAAATFVDRTRKLLRSRGENTDITDWMGRSGFAFRLKISRKTTYADGAFVFDWKQELNRLLMEHGYEPDFLCGQLEGSPIPLHSVAMLYDVVPFDAEEIIGFVRRAIDCGSPVLFFDTYVNRPYVHEWNLIYGYDDYSCTVELTDVLPPYRKTLTYEQLAASPLRFLCSARKTNRQPTKTDPCEAIRSIVMYAEEGDGFRGDNSYSSYTMGIGAYECWVGHLESGPRLANAYGHRYLTHVYANARAYAGRYIRSLELPGSWEEELGKAAEHYDLSAKLLAEASSLCPFDDHSVGSWSEPVIGRTIGLLQQAHDSERQAIGLLEKVCKTNESIIRHKGIRYDE
ncbi:sigma-70 family RNA polymerase sigma factor [Paenibacillus mesophilus]|uniref:RNA polymerase sigma factor n=1 Tax=Paenibacillus mesophilus TaxID=2582849 RepID=UPI00110E3EEF|nr:sigma-70 family RNA polymerase sigma factor [Paenibacillus mesophilus]TMV50046.1 sigma-70 family RNA polymerase sigma factor [Paenibacillus mesophilus]